MYTITVEDDKVSQEVIIFPQKAHDFKEEEWLDQPIVIFGRLEDDEDDENANPKFILDKFHALATAPIRRRAATVDTDKQHTTINRIHLSETNYKQMIAAAKAPVTFLLPNRQELICK
jgi:DNA polymerase III alpha subunit